MRKVERIKCGNGNCYLIQEKESAILVDTSRTQYRDNILKICKKSNVKLIILTHGHMDHIQNALYLSQELKVPIAMHKADYELTKNNMIEPLVAHKLLGKLILALSIKSFHNDIIEPFEPEIFLQEGDSLQAFGINATVVELPGHTKGSIGLNVWDSDLFVGDALMNMFYPTKSMLYGERSRMDESANKISSLGKKTIHFGHGKPVSNRKW
ncbi:MAG: fold metallo-hydrolase [Clostridiales bacterium]|jgi:glyoxylase-like metal-dependent hydrolase (beta-lactamase superfamily II)|nr:fold metallo-hydrolase [Clostridiales bacterium]